MRDFSLTSRVGEFAQGISYAYWAFDRRAHLADFDEWNAATYPGVLLRAQPDFVIAPLGTNNLLVVEAKGTTSHSPKNQMRRALGQAKDAQHHPAITECYSTVLTFATALGLPARVLVQDPMAEGEASLEDRWEVFRLHYAGWYEMACHYERALELRREASGRPLF